MDPFWKEYHFCGCLMNQWVTKPYTVGSDGVLEKTCYKKANIYFIEKKY